MSSYGPMPPYGNPYSQADMRWLGPSSGDQHRDIAYEQGRVFGSDSQVMQYFVLENTGRMKVLELNFTEANLLLKLLKSMPDYTPPTVVSAN